MLRGRGGGGDGQPAPRMLEVGQEAKFYMVDNDLPSTPVGGGRLAVHIVSPLPRRSVIFQRAEATRATCVVEECPCGGDGRRGAGGGRR